MFWHGCNYPWSTDGTTVYYGMDFGANVWGSHVGRVDPAGPDRSRLLADGPAWLHRRALVRLLATAGQASNTTIAGCRPAPIAHLFTDIDAALDIARSVGIRLALVLLDHRWMFEGVPDMIADPATGRPLEARLLMAARTCSTHAAAGRR